MNGRSAWKATSRACTSSTPGSSQVRAVEHACGSAARGTCAWGCRRSSRRPACRRRAGRRGRGTSRRRTRRSCRPRPSSRERRAARRRARPPSAPAATPARARSVRVDVDELCRAWPQPRRVGEVAGVGVQPGGGDAEVGAAVDVGEVDRAARGRRPARRRPPPGRCRVPSLRAKSLPRPPGSTASTPSVVAQLAGDRAQQPVAAHRGGHLAGVATVARASSRACSIECVRSTRNATPCPRSAASTAGSSLRGAAAAGARVDDQADGRRVISPALPRAARRRPLPGRRSRHRHRSPRHLR